MKNVMNRAWEIYRTLVGDHKAKLSMAMRMAWAEIKNTVKTVFDGVAKILKTDKYDTDSAYLTFKLWTKGDKTRIYINDYKRRTLGYIENDVVTINDNQGNSDFEIETAINNFRNTYTY